MGRKATERSRERSREKDADETETLEDRPAEGGEGASSSSF